VIFFRRILDFSELYDKLESYAKVAMKEFEWYQDVEEGEKSLLPGSYAVFALGLYDEKYFIYDYSVYKMGFYNTHWIDIEVEFKKRTAVSLLERRHVHEVSSVVRMLIEKLETIDEPATWEESSNEKK